MFVSTTPQALIDGANAITDQDGYSLISTAQFVEWMNNELTTMWQWARRCNRDAFTKVSAALTLPTTGIMSMTAAAPTGAAITDWSSPRGVDVQLAADRWKKVRLWSFVTRDRVGLLSYRFLGDSLYLLPVEQANSYSVRVWYLFSAPQAAVGSLSTAMSIPDGGDEYIKQGIAAKIRIRLEDDPTPHQQAQAAAKLATESFLGSSKGDQGAIADVSGEFGPEVW
jgi:hypothetical protein